MLHFVVSGLAKQNMSLQYLCVKKLLKMAKEWSCARNIAAKLRYNYIIFRLTDNSQQETKQLWPYIL